MSRLATRSKTSPLCAERSSTADAGSRLRRCASSTTCASAGRSARSCSRPRSSSLDSYLQMRSATRAGASRWTAWPAPGTTATIASGIAAAISFAIARNFASRSPAISVDRHPQLGEPVPQRRQRAGAEPAQRGGEPGRRVAQPVGVGPPPRRPAAGRPAQRRLRPARGERLDRHPARRRRRARSSAARRCARSAASASPGLAPISTSRCTRRARSASAACSAIRPPIE